MVWPERPKGRMSLQEGGRDRLLVSADQERQGLRTDPGSNFMDVSGNLAKRQVGGKQG